MQGDKGNENLVTGISVVVSPKSSENKKGVRRTQLDYIYEETCSTEVEYIRRLIVLQKVCLLIKSFLIPLLGQFSHCLYVQNFLTPMSTSSLLSEQMREFIKKLELTPIINLHHNILVIITSKREHLGKSFFAIVHFFKLYKSFYSSYELLEKYIYKLQNENHTFHNYLNKLESLSACVVGFFSLLIEPIQR